MDPIENYFSRFARIRYHYSTKDWRQLERFDALSRRLNWSETKHERELRLLRQAWTEVAESEFQGSSILHYQTLCQDLDIDPIPETVSKCKRELRQVFVNIVDLVEYRRNGRKGQKPKRFPSLKKLKGYCKVEVKYYRKERAKAEMLRVLLKQLH
jgi:hypothetical protein